jgi:metallophosphoesterase (TIGR00282 family)
MGNVFMHPHLACVRRRRARALAADSVKMVLVDLHAEVTSEKMAMGWYLDGRVSAVVGTHTHVPTADERLLPRGTGYITDVGMTGCYESVIGMDTQKSLKRFVQKLPERFEVAEGLGTICGVLLDLDEGTGLCRTITRLRVDENTAKTTIKVA